MRRAAFAILSTIAGLVGLLSFKTGATGSTSAPATIDTGHATGATSSSRTGTASSSTGQHGRKSATSNSGTYTGSVVETQYGPVQVRITVRNGKVTSATAVQYPGSDPRSAQINAYAVPYLQKESVGVTKASSVHMISGATYTSEGYLQSLQSALDKAGL